MFTGQLKQAHEGLADERRDYVGWLTMSHLPIGQLETRLPQLDAGKPDEPPADTVTA